MVAGLEFFKTAKTAKTVIMGDIMTTRNQLDLSLRSNMSLKWLCFFLLVGNVYGVQKESTKNEVSATPFWSGEDFSCIDNYRSMHKDDKKSSWIERLFSKEKRIKYRNDQLIATAHLIKSDDKSELKNLKPKYFFKQLDRYVQTNSSAEFSKLSEGDKQKNFADALDHHCQLVFNSNDFKEKKIQSIIIPGDGKKTGEEISKQVVLESSEAKKS